MYSLLADKSCRLRIQYRNTIQFVFSQSADQKSILLKVAIWKIEGPVWVVIPDIKSV